MKVDPAEVERALGAQGPLAARLSGYRPRREQIDLALSFTESLNDGTPAILEAGTGTGKTYAYLVPLLLGQVKAVVATSTKTLQEQLLGKDIAELAGCLGLEINARLLKGRSNYICKRRLAAAESGNLIDDMFPDERSVSGELVKVSDYELQTADGDCAGVAGVAATSRIWPLVTSTADNCTGQRCDDYSQCYVYSAREHAKEAQIVVANHALLLSNAALPEQGKEMLPGFDAIVFDEAHGLVEDLPRHFATKCSSVEIIQKLKEMHALVHEKWPAQGGLLALIEKAGFAAEEFVEVCGSFEAASLQQAAVVGNRDCARLLGVLLEALDELEDNGFIGEQDELRSTGGYIHATSSAIVEWMNVKSDRICWLERNKSGVVLVSAPADCQELFGSNFVDKSTVAMFSATMSVDRSLDYFAGNLGLDKARQRIYDSPFDYSRQTRLLLPADMPDPARDAKGFASAVAKLAARLVKAGNHGAFVLCTNRRSMHQIAASLDKLMARHDCEIFKQGDAPPAKLVAQFKRHTGRRVLVGTRTFWQGVDVVGSALSLVVIDRLPFTPPSDPLLAARSEVLGDDSFMQLQIPQASILLKQAAGRLIRSETEQGVLVICDPRLQSKKYGQIILRSLPPFKQTTDEDEAAGFLAAIE